MHIRVLDCDQWVLDIRTRMPFRYGTAEMTALPHLIVRATVEIDGHAGAGLAADSLAPKWFTKNPRDSFDQELRSMFEVISHASETVLHHEAESPFELWRALYQAQASWASAMRHPPLLWNFGVSLIERAIIDAFCRITKRSFAQSLRDNSLGIDLGVIHGELAGFSPADLLPPPRRQLILRHTIGCSDPLFEDDIPPEEQIHDSLPQSLHECVTTHKLTHFKVKVYGEAERDVPRLRRIARVLASVGDRLRFTLDGNEQFHDLDTFRRYWETLCNSGSTLDEFLRYLLLVEQPLHRDVALSDGVCKEMKRWVNRPPIIIDESDALLDSLARALQCGYVGTSHKNCKGVFKSIAHAALMHHLRRSCPMGRVYVHSAEDLVNIGPIALLQDLAVVACLGVDHVERNGHHYFRGLDMWPEDVQLETLRRHGDLYRQHPLGFPTVQILDGCIDVSSVVQAPFGLEFELDPTRFMPLRQWQEKSLPEQHP